jgi:hypothetical protein
MSKFKFFVIIVVVALCIGIGVFRSFLIQHSVAITLNTPSATLFEADASKNNTVVKKIRDLTSSTTVSMSDGYYCIIASGKMYSSDPICFTVYKKDMSVVVSPAYSKTHLDTVLKTEQSAITTSFLTRYSHIISNYVVCNGSLYDRGQWYAATLSQKKQSPADSVDTYRFVMKKEGGTWSIVANPRIVLSKFDFNDIPIAVLSNANNLKNCQ